MPGLVELLDDERNYLKVVMGGLGLSAIAQSFFQKRLSSEPGWNHAQGWQTEIGAWNIALLTLLLFVIDSKHRKAIEAAMAGIISLTFLLSLNHMVSFMKQKSPVWHLVLGVINAVGCIWGLLICIRKGYGLTDD